VRSQVGEGPISFLPHQASVSALTASIRPSAAEEVAAAPIGAGIEVPDVQVKVDGADV